MDMLNGIFIGFIIGYAVCALCRMAGRKDRGEW